MDFFPLALENTYLHFSGVCRLRTDYKKHPLPLQTPQAPGTVCLPQISKTQHLSYVSLPGHPFQVMRNPQPLWPLLPDVPHFLKAHQRVPVPLDSLSITDYFQRLPNNQRKKEPTTVRIKGTTELVFQSPARLRTRVEAAQIDSSTFSFAGREVPAQTRVFWRWRKIP